MKQKDPEKVEALFRAVLTACSREGLRFVNIPQLAREAGIAVGTFYLYFSGKEALLKELFIRLKKESGKEILRGHDPEAPFRIEFKRMCRNYFGYLLHHRAETAFLEQYVGVGVQDQDTRAVTDDYVSPIAALLRRGMNEELIKTQEPELLLRFIAATLKESVKYFASSGKAEDAAWADYAAELCLNGVSA